MIGFVKILPVGYSFGGNFKNKVVSISLSALLPEKKK